MGQPLQSMTGVGFAAGPSEVGDVRIEVRSVNGRGLAIKLRLPTACSAYEAAIDELLRARVQRGTLTAVVERKTPGTVLPDAAALGAVARGLRELAAQLQLDPPRLADVLGVALAARQGDALTSRPLPPALGALCERAVTELLARRADEGRGTAAAILAELAAHEALAAAAAARAPALVAAYRERLLQRVQEFTAEHVPDASPAADLVREVALYADRVDVAEESQRLAAHTAELRALLQRGGEVGKRLEFLLQELHRETNTLGAKSPDAAIAHAVVAMKAHVERMKEQAANLQ
ncbi:MAG: YicC/YloC family endoribonuclease [Planctomycetota bacterium]|jgi:uncharacterized protein (TIGR00255 family)